jgi:hypothetical protein
MQNINIFDQQSHSPSQTQETRPQTAWEQEPSIESYEEEEEEEEEKAPAPAPAPNARKRDYLSNFMSSAGNLIKQGASKALLTAEDGGKIISVLTEENS